MKSLSLNFFTVKKHFLLTDTGVPYKHPLRSTLLVFSIQLYWP
jgi:hypothetical protein